MNRFSLKNIGNPKMIEGDDRIRAKKCADAIKFFLKENSYELLPRLLLTGAQIKAGYIIIPKPQLIQVQQGYLNIVPMKG